MEVIGIVAVFCFGNEIDKAAHDPAVQFWHLIVWHAVLAHVKVRNVAEHETEGVSDLSISVGNLLDDAVADRYVAAIVGRCHPETQDVGTILFDNVLRIDTIALRLTHLVAFFVNEEAVGQEAFVWCLTVNSHRGAE